MSKSTATTSESGAQELVFDTNITFVNIDENGKKSRRCRKGLASCEVDEMEPEMKPIPGRLVVFLVGQTGMNLETTEVVEVGRRLRAPRISGCNPKTEGNKLEKGGWTVLR